MKDPLFPGVRVALLSLMLLIGACGGESESGQGGDMSTVQAAQNVDWPSVKAPVAEKRETVFSQHGIDRIDEFAWLRDDNWQAVLSDPSVLRGDIRTHLEAEASYYEAMTADLSDLQETLFKEMKGRIREDESTVPLRDGPWEYYRRYVEGGEYPLYARRAVAEGPQPEQVLYDGNVERGDSEFFSVGAVVQSPDHRLIAIATDRVGSERMTIEIRDIEAGTVFPDRVTDASDDPVWAADAKSFFYAVRDDNGRAHQVKHHVLGTPASADRIVFTASDPEYFASVYTSQSGEYILFRGGNYSSNEIHYLRSDQPGGEPTVFAQPQADVRYSIDHRGDSWYVRTNRDGAVDFKIMRASLDAHAPEQWVEFVPHRAGRMITSITTYRDFLVWGEREDAKNALAVSDYEDGVRRIAFEQPAFSVDYVSGFEFATDNLRMVYESPSQPAQTFDYNLRTDERLLRKTLEVPSGHNPDLYTVDMLEAVAADGARVPVMVLRLKTTAIDGSAPALLTGYGSYGAFSSDYFSRVALSLVDRGFIFARAHIRGGSAKGQQWYLDGKLGKKPNSFSDFVAAGEMLADKQYTRRGNIVASGGSAGGLLVGAALNLAPDLFGGVIAAVPFVDVITTISDDTLPLTPPEWKEWGNPITSAEEYGWIAGYSPYDNIRSGVRYPPIMATGGLTDYRVTYWEPAKWVARLRDQTTGGPVLMRMNMAAGHAGSAARFESLLEYAHLYAFALKVTGLDKVLPVAHN